MTLPGLSRKYVKLCVSDGVARIKLGLADELRPGNLYAQCDRGFAGEGMTAAAQMHRSR